MLTNEHAAPVSTDPAPSIQFDPIAEGEADTARAEALSASAPPGALPASAPTEAISASGDRGRRRRFAWIALVVLFGCFEIDQLRALFGYSRLATDEDQTLLWFAGRELLNEIGGRAATEVGDWDPTAAVGILRRMDVVEKLLLAARDSVLQLVARLRWLLTRGADLQHVQDDYIAVALGLLEDAETYAVLAAAGDTDAIAAVQAVIHRLEALHHKLSAELEETDQRDRDA